MSDKPTKEQCWTWLVIGKSVGPDWFSGDDVPAWLDATAEYLQTTSATISHLQQSLRECEGKLREAEAAQVSIFDYEYPPVAQQGAPNHEVLELLTADVANSWIATILRLERERDAALEREKSREWQPIETAPKTGYLIGAWKDGKWHAREMWWDDSVDEWTDTISDRYLKPTHWLPLPTPPSALPTAVEPDEAAQCDAPDCVDGVAYGETCYKCAGTGRQAPKADKGST